MCGQTILKDLSLPVSRPVEAQKAKFSFLCLFFRGGFSFPVAVEAQVLFKWGKGQRENKEIGWRIGRIDYV